MKRLAQIIIIVLFTLGSSLVNAACNSTTLTPAIYFESASNTLPLGPTSWTGEANFYAIVNVTPGGNCTSVACTNSSCPLGESVCKTPNMNYCSIGASLCFNNTCNNTQTYTLYLMGQPYVNSFNKTGLENNALPFSKADFNDQFITAEYANLAGLQIVTLPTNGTLELSGVPVIPGQVIAADSINNLTFVPDSNWHGPANFSWNANDGYIYAPTPASVNIAIAELPLPTLSPISKSGFVNSVIPFALADIVFSDPDSSSLATIEIVSLPVNGVLKMAGNPITVIPYVFAASDIKKVTYEPNTNWYGSDIFTWTASVDGENYPDPVDASITIDQPKFTFSIKVCV